MKLLFKQKMFSLFGGYNIYDEYDNSIVYTVKGQFALGHSFKIFDKNNIEVGMVKQQMFSWLPKFKMYYGDQYVGCISREFSFFKPKYNIDCNGWYVEGNFFEWDYQILDSNGAEIASISKELLKCTDTYMIDVHNPQDALIVLMFVLAIDAEKCSRKN